MKITPPRVVVFESNSCGNKTKGTTLLKQSSPGANNNCANELSSWESAGFLLAT